jgi:hypothetical protein
MKTPLLLFFAVVALAQTPSVLPGPAAIRPTSPAPAAAAPAPERKQIPQEYVTLFNGLVAQIQAVQKSVQAAEDKLRVEVCAPIPVADCEVNWQAGTFGKKFVPPAPLSGSINDGPTKVVVTPPMTVTKPGPVAPGPATQTK